MMKHQTVEGFEPSMSVLIYRTLTFGKPKRVIHTICLKYKIAGKVLICPTLRSLLNPC